jgi:hypothetical protein
MLKELASGQEQDLSAHHKEVVLYRLRLDETHNPLSEAFHHGRLRICVSDISVQDNDSRYPPQLLFEFRRPFYLLSRPTKRLLVYRNNCRTAGGEELVV